MADPTIPRRGQERERDAVDLGVLALVLLDLERGRLLEFRIERVAAVELHGVDEQGDRPVPPSVAIRVAEQAEVARRRSGRAVALSAVVAGDPLVDHPTDRGVRA